MLTEQRHEIILNLLSEKRSITVTELKELLNTSESTIRRDLNTLDEQGRLTKVFGGAVEKINGVSTTELSVSQKADVNTEEKKKIAMYAARLVVPRQSLFHLMISYILMPEQPQNILLIILKRKPQLM